MSTLNFAIVFKFSTVGLPARSDVITTVWDAVLSSARDLQRESVRDA
jgi:hypothetical protein